MLFLCTALAIHASDPPPISEAIRKCASDFKKVAEIEASCHWPKSDIYSGQTHQDTWHVDQLAFNEDQLQSLSTMLMGTSYCECLSRSRSESSHLNPRCLTSTSKITNRNLPKTSIMWYLILKKLLLFMFELVNQLFSRYMTLYVGKSPKNFRKFGNGTESLRASREAELSLVISLVTRHQSLVWDLDIPKHRFKVTRIFSVFTRRTLHNATARRTE